MSRKINDETIIQHLADGWSRKEIANRYRLSPRTVETYIGIMLTAHQAKHIANLVAIFFRDAMID